MTIPPETERGYGKPVEEVARAIAREFGFDFDRFEPASQGKYMRKAEAALRELRRRGWLSDLGIIAIEAERMEK